MKTERKNLAHEFFYIIIRFLAIYENENDKWKIRPELNDLISRLFEIHNIIGTEGDKYMDMILDLRTSLDSNGSLDNFWGNYYEFILNLEK